LLANNQLQFEMINIFIIVLFNLRSFFLSQIDQIEQINSYCTLNTTNNKLKCEDFFALSDLTFESGSFLGKKISIFHLKPATYAYAIEFDDKELNIDELFDSFDEDYEVELENFANFNIKSNPFSLIKKH